MKFLRRRALFLLLLLISQVEVFDRNSTVHPVDVKSLYLKQINTTITDCPEGWVYIPSQEECLRKVALGLDCEKNRQCNSVTEYSYCKAVHKDGDTRVFYECRCIDGYKSIDYYGPKCVPIRSCNHTGFNEEYHQYDCEEYQFCRLNVCKCGVGLHFNEYTDECVTINECHPAQVFTQAYGCLPTVKLGLACNHSQQCSSLNSNSHCSFSLSLGRSICDCEVGFNAEPDSGGVYSCFEVDQNLGEPKRTTDESLRISPKQITQAPKIKAEEEERKAIERERIEELKDNESMGEMTKWSFLDTVSLGWIFGFCFVALAIAFFIGFMANRDWAALKVKASQRQGEYASIQERTAQIVVYED